MRVHQARYAGFAGVRLHWRGLRLKANVDVCAQMSLLRLRQDAPNANAVTRVEPALHLGNTWSLSDQWVSPFIGIHAELVPFPVAIAVEPRGVIGHSSAVWFGLALGLAIGND